VGRSGFPNNRYDLTPVPNFNVVIVDYEDQFVFDRLVSAEMLVKLVELRRYMGECTHRSFSVGALLGELRKTAELEIEISVFPSKRVGSVT